MAKRTLFAYVQGTDLDGVSEALAAKLDELVAERKWISKDVWVVNQRVDGAGGAVAEWDLGLNLALPAARPKTATWLEDVVAIATAFGALHAETGRKFVIGIHDAKTDAVKDLFFVDSNTPDLNALRAALEAA